MQKNTVKETCIVNSIVLFILIVSFSITLFITDKLGYYIMMSVSFILLLTHSKKAFLSVSVKYLEDSAVFSIMNPAAGNHNSV